MKMQIYKIQKSIVGISISKGSKGLYKKNPVGSVIAGYLWNIYRILSYGCIPDLEILLGDQGDLKGYMDTEDMQKARLRFLS